MWKQECRLQEVAEVPYLTLFDALPSGLDLQVDAGKCADGSNSDKHRESYSLAIRHLFSFFTSMLQTTVTTRDS